MIIGVRTTVPCYWILQYNASLKYENDLFSVMSGVPQHPCTICGKGGHPASRCKELGIPPEGFYKPAPGQHQHDDDEDEKLQNQYVIHSYKMWLNQLLSSPRVRRLF